MVGSDFQHGGFISKVEILPLYATTIGYNHKVSTSNIEIWSPKWVFVFHLIQKAENGENSIKEISQRNRKEAQYRK